MALSVAMSFYHFPVLLPRRTGTRADLLDGEEVFVPFLLKFLLRSW